MLPSRKLRHGALVVHRYVGLAMSAFLLVAGLTGSMMAFYVPLDRWLNPELFVPAAHASAPLLDPFTLVEKLNAQLPPEQAMQSVLLRIKPDQTVNYWVDGRETFVDPYSGKIVGSRKFGDLSEGRKSVLTFFYELHFTLGLGEVGSFMFGVVALLWTVDCFVGAYLTFPLPAQRSGPNRKSWFLRWLPMWQLKTSKLFTLMFTWHRASGLWVWLVILMFAWSAVALNMGDVYEPVTHAIFGKPPEHELPELEHPIKKEPIPLREAHALGRSLIAREAERRHFRVLGENYLYWMPEHGAFSYSVESTLDVSERLADTSVSFTPSGELLAFDAPTGAHAGLTFSSWLVALHFGAVRIGGTAYRAFVCAMGFAVALLSVTGVWIWWKKRKNRAASPDVARRGRSAPANLEIVTAANVIK